MGSHLTVGKNRVWIDPTDLAMGGLSRLAADASAVQPEALVAFAYSGLIQYLSQSHEVVPFAYDWRRSIRDEARRLAQAVTAKLDESGNSRSACSRLPIPWAGCWPGQW